MALPPSGGYFLCFGVRCRGNLGLMYLLCLYRQGLLVVPFYMEGVRLGGD